MSLNKFLTDTIEKAASNGIAVHLICDKEFKYGGLYDENESLLTVCVTDSEGKINSDWIKLFIHESCHMDQDVEKSDIWSASVIGDTNAFSIVDEWLSNIIELSPTQIEKYIDIMQAIEIDCEKRSVQKIKKYKLKIDIKQYIKEANAYIYFYEALKETRQWTKPGKGPYRIPQVVELCPDTFQKNYKENREVIELIKKHCYE